MDPSDAAQGRTVAAAFRHDTRTSSLQPQPTPSTTHALIKQPADERMNVLAPSRPSTSHRPLSFELPNIIYPQQDLLTITFPSSFPFSQNSNSIPSGPDRHIDQDQKSAHEPNTSARKRLHAGEPNSALRHSKGSTLNPPRRSQRFNHMRPTLSGPPHSRRRLLDDEHLGLEHRRSIQDIGMGMFDDPRESGLLYEANALKLRASYAVADTLVLATSTSLAPPTSPISSNERNEPLNEYLDSACISEGNNSLDYSLPLTVRDGTKYNTSPGKLSLRKGSAKVHFNRFLPDFKGKTKGKMGSETEEDSWIYSNIDEYIHDLRQTLQESTVVRQRVQRSQAELGRRYSTIFRTLNTNHLPPNPLEVIRWRKRVLEWRQRETLKAEKEYLDETETRVNNLNRLRLSVIPNPHLLSTQLPSGSTANTGDSLIVSSRKEGKEWNLTAQLVEDYLHAGSQCVGVQVEEVNERVAPLLSDSCDELVAADDEAGTDTKRVVGSGTLVRGLFGDIPNNSDHSDNEKESFAAREKMKKAVSRTALDHGMRNEKDQIRIPDQNDKTFTSTNSGPDLSTSPDLLLPSNDAELSFSEDEQSLARGIRPDNDTARTLGGALNSSITSTRTHDAVRGYSGLVNTLAPSEHLNDGNSRFNRIHLTESRHLWNPDLRSSNIGNIRNSNKQRIEEEIVEIYTERGSVLRTSRSQHKHGSQVLQMSAAAIQDYCGMMSRLGESLSTSHMPTSSNTAFGRFNDVSSEQSKNVTRIYNTLKDSLSQNDDTMAGQRGHVTKGNHSLESVLQELGKIPLTLQSHDVSLQSSTLTVRNWIKDLGTGWSSLADLMKTLKDQQLDTSNRLDKAKELHKCISLRVERVPPELGRNEELTRQLSPDNSTGQLLPDWVPQWAQEVLRWLSPHVQRLADMVLNTWRVIYVVVGWISWFLPQSSKTLFSWLLSSFFILIWMLCRMVYAVILWIFQIPPVRIFLTLIGIIFDAFHGNQHIFWSAFLPFGSFVIWQYLSASSSP